MATYLFVENGKITPITRIANVEKFTNAMKKVYEEASQRQQEPSQTALGWRRQTREVQFPDENTFSRVLTEGSYESLGDLQRKSLLLSSMHFMDPYNFDLERVQRCLIHYAVPDGRIIPFCT